MMWQIKNWSELERDDLHALLRLRTDVFVVEQDCPYPELDGKDMHSVHVWAASEAEASGAPAAACARVVLAPGDVPKIGRVAIAQQHRGSGLGQTLMLHALHATRAASGRTPIHISAQSHLQDFYGHFGFVSVGEGYLEDGIPHQAMERPADPLEAWGGALDHALQALFGLSAVQGAAGRWGTGETLRHLTLVAQGVGAAMGRQRPSEVGRPLQAAHHAAAAALIGAMASPRTFRVPEGLPLPAMGEEAPEDRPALLAALKQCRDGMRSWSAGDWSATAFRHPAVGWIGGEDVLAFLTFHILHHRRILQRQGAAKND